MRTEYGVLLFACLVSSSLAKPAVVYLGYQDSLGQYSFGYSAPGSARSEVRTLNGATRGAYSYVDGNGVIHSTEYVADGENGFRVVASNLPEAPVPVQDTPEVSVARAAHLRAVELARQAGEPAGENSESKETPAQETEPEQNQGTNEGKPEESAELVEAKSAGVPSEGGNQEMQMGQEGKKEEESQPEKEALEARTVQEVKEVKVPATIPVYQISYGTDNKPEFSVLDSPVEVTGAWAALTEAALKNKQEKTEQPAVTKQAPAEAEEKDTKPVYTPVQVLPLSQLPSILRYAPVHYVAYDVL